MAISGLLRPLYLVGFLGGLVRLGSASNRGSERSLRRAARLRGLPQKLAQHLSFTQREHFGDLASLQVMGLPVPLDDLEPVLGRELGSGRRELRLEQHPVSAASIGQVHRGCWRGRSVAVKIRYPGIERQVNADFRVLRAVLGCVPPAGPFRRARARLGAYLEELRQEVVRELDYRQEAENTAVLGALARRHGGVVCPAVVAEISTESVLVTEWAEGEPLNDFLAAASSEDREWFRQTLFGFHRHCLFDHGLLHADPHPGNFLVRASAGVGREIVILDHGCVKRFSPEFVGALRRLVEAIRRGDARGIADECFTLGLEAVLVEQVEAMLPFLCEVMLAPFLDEEFRFDTWRLGYQVNTILGSLRAPFEWAPPPEVALLLRAFGIFGYAGRPTGAPAQREAA